MYDAQMKITQDVKKYCFVLAISIYNIFTVQLYSQSPEWNLDFEVWDLNDTTPDLWFDTTIIENRTGLFPPNWHYRPDHIPEGTGLGRTTDATHGDYAVTLSGFYSYEVMRIISGNSAERPGWPIDIRPTTLSGDYKAILLGTGCDSLKAYVDVFLTKYNTSEVRRDTIGVGSIILNETANSYAQFHVNLQYIDSITSPDTVTVVLAKQRFGFDTPPECLECSHVFFDNLQFTTSTSSTEQISANHSIQVLPNPSSQYFTIMSSCPDCRFNITLVSLNGVPIWKYDGIRNEETIDVSKLGNGMYLVKIEDTETQTHTVRSKT